jgi:tetratricopeptide (TPR) repeat protein
MRAKKTRSPVLSRDARIKSTKAADGLLSGDSWAARVVAPAVLIVAAGVVYANSFSAPLVFDGEIALLNNSEIRQLWPQTFKEWLGRPVGFLTFRLNYTLNEHFAREGFDVWGYHGVNLAIHVAAGLALFGIVRRTLSRGQVAQRYAGAAWFLALAIALLWSVHPLNTQSVTYIYQRLEALMGLFYLLTLYAFIRAVDSRRAIWWYAASVLCGMMAVATKEVAVTLPLAVLWYDRAFVASSWREILRRRWPYYAGLIGTWVLLALLMALRIEDYPAGGVFKVDGVSPWGYARSQPGVLLHYLKLVFWPRGLCLDYNWPVAETAKQIVPQMLAILSLLAATLWCMVRRPKLGFVAGSFFLILGPTSSIAPLRDLAFEHRMYLPLCSIVVLLVLAAYEIRQVPLAKLGGLAARGVSPKLAPALALLVAAGALGYLTWLRNEDYRTAFVIWNDTVAKRPDNPRAYHNRGYAYEKLGRDDLAMADYDEALKLKDDYVETRVNRGILFRRLGRYEDALRDHAKTIELKPRDADAYYTRAYTHGLFNRHKPAIDDYTAGIALDHPANSMKAYYNRGNSHHALGQDKEAIADYTETIRQRPDFVSSYRNRGICYQRAGQSELAVADFTKSLQLAPNEAEFYFYRADCNAALGRYAQAIADVARSIELQPQVSRSYLARARYYFMNKQYRLSSADLDKFKSLGGQSTPESVALESALNGAQ